MSVSAARALRAIGGSSSAPSAVPLREVNAEPFRISAEIVNLGKVPLPKLRETIRRDAADLFWRTFDGDSVHAKSLDAARKIGVSADTFARLCDGATDKVEYALIKAMLYWHDQKYGALPPLQGLIARAQRGCE